MVRSSCCPECGAAFGATRDERSEGGVDGLSDGLRMVWGTSAWAPLYATCLGTSWTPTLIGLIALLVATFRALGWWRIRREGWATHPVLAPWTQTLTMACTVELATAATLTTVAAAFGSASFFPWLSAPLRSVAVLAACGQSLLLLLVVRRLWKHMRLPRAEWFDDLAPYALAIGAVAIATAPALGLFATLFTLPAAQDGARMLSLAALVVGFIAFTGGTIVVCDRTNRLAEAARRADGLDVPDDVDDSWDGTRRPKSKEDPTAAAAPRRASQPKNDDPIPLD